MDPVEASARLANNPAFPTIAGADIPEVDRMAMMEVDRIMEEDLGIALVQMMENAGRCLARLTQAINPERRPVLALAGRGGNGGGVLTAARRLTGWGYTVDVVTTAAPEEFGGVPARQLKIVQALGMAVSTDMPGDIDDYDIVLDGLVGYSLAGPLSARAGDAAAIVNARAKALCLSLDVPSGFDSERGVPTSGAVRPDAILTIAAPKSGLLESYPGTPVYLADISVPDFVFDRVAGRRFAPPADISRIV